MSVEMIPQLILLMKIFGSVIVFLLSVISVLGGVIWADLRKEICSIKADSAKALIEHKDEERIRCRTCSSQNMKDHDEMWQTIDLCCPRGSE